MTKGSQEERELAFGALTESMEGGVYLKTALHRTFRRHSGLAKRERAFITRLAEGVMERKLEMDYVIGRFSKVPIQKMRPAIRTILRMGAYQILYMDGVPLGVSCNESVELAKKKGFQSLKGFVNGILRNIGRNIGNIPYPSKDEDGINYYSVKYSMPDWLVSKWLGELGETAMEGMLQSLYEDGATTIGCNTEKISVDDFMDCLDEAGILYEKGRYHHHAIRLLQYDNVESLPGFREGWFLVQDESSMFVSKCAGLEQGHSVLDVCAAPGGKSLHAAQLLKGSGKIIACDRNESKVNKIKENLIRLGFPNIGVAIQDALAFREDWEEGFDVVLADLPCSGLGTMARKCDIKYRLTPEELDALQDLQRRILENVSRYAKPGGVLLYSTCTIQEGENQENVEWAVEHLPLVLESLDPCLPRALHGDTTSKGYLQLIPGKHACDGFFISKFLKKGNNVT